MTKTSKTVIFLNMIMLVITGCGGGGSGGGNSVSGNDSTSTNTVPSAPSELSAVAISSSQIDLTWSDNSGNETGFHLERKGAGVNYYTQIEVLQANVKSYSDTNLAANTTYYYRLKSYNSSGESAYSNIATVATPKIPVPDKPTDLVAIPMSSSQINIYWTDNSNNETGFKVERIADAEITPALIATLEANASYFFDTNLTEGTSYVYRVKAYNDGGDSSFSNSADTTTFLAAPFLEGLAISSSQINLTWLDNSNNELWFNIERKVGIFGSYSQIAKVTYNTVNYSDASGLLDGTSYYYRIEAVGKNSVYSNEVSVVTPLNAPSLTAINVLSYSEISLTWTDNSNSESGYIIERSKSTAFQINIGNGVFTQIATTGSNESFFLDAAANDGTTYYYRVKAYNLNSQSSYSNIKYTTTPFIWSKLSVGKGNTCALKTNGTLWSWGSNNNYELGLGDTLSRDEPTQVGIDTAWAQISSMEFHTIGLKNNGTLWEWGDGITSPTQTGSDTNWAQIACGYTHRLAMKSDGSLWAWGYNNNGALGMGDFNFGYYDYGYGIGYYYIIDSPAKIGTDTNWKQIGVGVNFSVALKTDGTLWSWGYNLYGQLGLGDSTDRNAPTKIGTDTDWAKIAVGGYHVLAIKTDGSLWSWGYNAFGQLGRDGGWDTPIKIGSEINWAEISCGDQDSFAIKNNGTLYAWGWNYYAQLGIGDYTNRSTPSQIGGDTDWEQVVAGYAHTIARKTDNTIWSWGNNDGGQLGVGDTVVRTIPTQAGK